jgi:hypothetical protein
MSLENDILEHGSFIGIVWDSRVYTVFNAEISKSVILGDYGPSFFLLFLAELLWISMECAIHGGTQQFGLLGRFALSARLGLPAFVEK